MKSNKSASKKGGASFSGTDLLGVDVPDPSDPNAFALPIPTVGGGQTPPASRPQPAARPQQRPAPAAHVQPQFQQRPPQQRPQQQLPVTLNGTTLHFTGVPTETDHCDVEVLWGQPGCLDLHLQPVPGFPQTVQTTQCSLDSSMPFIQGLQPGSRLEARVAACDVKKNVLMSGPQNLFALVPQRTVGNNSPTTVTTILQTSATSATATTPAPIAVAAPVKRKRRTTRKKTAKAASTPTAAAPAATAPAQSPSSGNTEVIIKVSFDPVTGKVSWPKITGAEHYEPRLMAQGPTDLVPHFVNGATPTTTIDSEFILDMAAVNTLPPDNKVSVCLKALAPISDGGRILGSGWTLVKQPPTTTTASTTAPGAPAGASTTTPAGTTTASTTTGNATPTTFFGKAKQLLAEKVGWKTVVGIAMVLIALILLKFDGFHFEAKTAAVPPSAQTDNPALKAEIDELKRQVAEAKRATERREETPRLIPARMDVTVHHDAERKVQPFRAQQWYESVSNIEWQDALEKAVQNPPSDCFFVTVNLPDDGKAYAYPYPTEDASGRRWHITPLKNPNYVKCSYNLGDKHDPKWSPDREYNQDVSAALLKCSGGSPRQVKFRLERF